MHTHPYSQVHMHACTWNMSTVQSMRPTGGMYDGVICISWTFTKSIPEKYVCCLIISKLTIRLRWSICRSWTNTSKQQQGVNKHCNPPHTLHVCLRVKYVQSKLYYFSKWSYWKFCTHFVDIVRKSVLDFWQPFPYMQIRGLWTSSLLWKAAWTVHF